VMLTWTSVFIGESSVALRRLYTRVFARPRRLHEQRLPGDRRDFGTRLFTASRAAVRGSGPAFDEPRPTPHARFLQSRQCPILDTVSAPSGNVSNSSRAGLLHHARRARSASAVARQSLRAAPFGGLRQQRGDRDGRGRNLSSGATALGGVKRRAAGMSVAIVGFTPSRSEAAARWRPRPAPAARSAASGPYPTRRRSGSRRRRRSPARRGTPRRSRAPRSRAPAARSARGRTRSARR